MLVRLEILRAAPHPIREALLRNQLLEELRFLALAARQALDFSLVAQHRVAEDVGTIIAVIARFLMPRRLARARRSHDGAENIERQFRVLLAERRETLGALEDFLLAVLMLARADEAAVEHRVRRDDSRLRVLRVLVKPLPELVRMAEILAVAEDVIRRHDDVVTELPHDVGRLLVRNRTVVMRDEDNLVRACWRLVPCVCRRRHHK